MHEHSLAQQNRLSALSLDGRIDQALVFAVEVIRFSIEDLLTDNFQFLKQAKYFDPF